jgi:hypothetical protein
VNCCDSWGVIPLEKPGYMLEHLSIWRYLRIGVHLYTSVSDNSSSAGNQQGSPLSSAFGERHDPSETTRRAPRTAEIRAYLLGAIHDGTFNQLHGSFRFSQKGRSWLLLLQQLLREIGKRAWIYREGRDRKVFALETTASFLDLRFDPLRLRSRTERRAYVRGYFDAEGGIPHTRHARFYIQLCQKNREELRSVRAILEEEGIRCGVLHNPSKTIDPDYWRFFVRTQSHDAFLTIISTWHPRKQRYLQQRMKI